MRALIGAGALLSFLLIMTVGPTQGVLAGVADPSGGRISGNNQGDEIVLEGERTPGSRTQTGELAGGAPTAKTVARYVYACPGNSYLTDPAVNVSCEGAVQACTEDIQARQYLRFTARVAGSEPVPPPGPRWSLAGTSCITPEEAAEAQVTFTLADFRRLPLPAATPAIQPAGGQALIRARTNVYVDPASTERQTFDLTLLGTPVQVRATPSEYTWDFGDGTSPLTTADPGAPYPELTTWHEYATPGTVEIGLTTTYTGEYSVAGGPWQTIPGTAEVASAPQPLQLLSTSNRLTG